VLTLDRAVRNLTCLGVPLPDAVHAATSAPARLLGVDDLGVLREGGLADLAVLAPDLQVTRTLVAGAEVFAAA
jgi:N-acetylglucosamine-6-phosphate deacetylase